MALRNLNDRPDNGGSVEPTLVPKIVETAINQKLCPNIPTSVAKARNFSGDPQRRRSIGMPSSFAKEGK